MIQGEIMKYEKMYKLIMRHVEKNDTSLAKKLSCEKKEEMNEKVVTRVCDQIMSIARNDIILDSTQIYNCETGKSTMNYNRNNILLNGIIDTCLTEEYYINLRKYFK